MQEGYGDGGADVFFGLFAVSHLRSPVCYIVCTLGKKIPRDYAVYITNINEGSNGGVVFACFPHANLLLDSIEAFGELLLRHPLGFSQGGKSFRVKCPDRFHGYSSTIIINACQAFFLD